MTLTLAFTLWTIAIGGATALLAWWKVITRKLYRRDMT
jgi:hypothetical protein